jgi:hypothetical protein
MIFVLNFIVGARFIAPSLVPWWDMQGVINRAPTELRVGGIMENEIDIAVLEKEHLAELAQSSDLIFSGTVESIGNPPRDWSGYFNSYQEVRYKVEKVFKGQESGPEITIQHVIVYGGKTARTGEDPALSPELFFVKAKLIVCARKSQSGVYKSLDENYGALPATPEWINKIESAL